MSMSDWLAFPTSPFDKSFLTGLAVLSALLVYLIISHRRR